MIATTPNYCKWKQALQVGLVVLMLVTSLIPMGAAHAEPGLPDSTGFGYGAQVNPTGVELVLAMNVAASLGLDWISVELDWAQAWPTAAGAPDFSLIGRVMELASQRDLTVLVVLHNAPTWATTPAGPDPEITSQLVLLLSQLYPDVLHAIELFPGANTAARWGAPPDPASYAHLYLTCLNAVANHPYPLALISGGLWIGEPTHPGHIRDTDFLTGLYTHGAAEWLPIVGLRLNVQAGEIATLSSSTQPNVLRHYEIIRQVMVANGHAKGLLWVTAFNWPSAQSTPSLEDDHAQSDWTLQAYRSLRSQLYIGAAFFGCLNPPPSKINPASQQCLIASADSSGSPNLHPFLSALGETINHERQARSLIIEPILFTKQHLRQTGAWNKS